MSRGPAALVVAALGRLVAVALGVRRPQGQVVPQQLHDQRRVLVRVLVQGVQLSDRVVERLQCYNILTPRERVTKCNT